MDHNVLDHKKYYGFELKYFSNTNGVVCTRDYGSLCCCPDTACMLAIDMAIQGPPDIPYKNNDIVTLFHSSGTCADSFFLKKDKKYDLEPQEKIFFDPNNDVIRTFWCYKNMPEFSLAELDHSMDVFFDPFKKVENISNSRMYALCFLLNFVKYERSTSADTSHYILYLAFLLLFADYRWFVFYLDCLVNCSPESANYENNLNCILTYLRVCKFLLEIQKGSTSSLYFNLYRAVNSSPPANSLEDDAKDVIKLLIRVLSMQVPLFVKQLRVISVDNVLGMIVQQILDLQSGNRTWEQQLIHWLEHNNEPENRIAEVKTLLKSVNIAASGDPEIGADRQ